MNAVDTNILLYVHDPRDPVKQATAACLEGGVARLYSEDFDAYPEVDGLEIINPLRER
jgi:predicted nucleic acid-binding protein